VSWTGWKPNPQIYRRVFGTTEVVCGMLLAFIPGCYVTWPAFVLLTILILFLLTISCHGEISIHKILLQKLYVVCCWLSSIYIYDDFVKVPWNFYGKNRKMLTFLLYLYVQLAALFQNAKDVQNLNTLYSGDDGCTCSRNLTGFWQKLKGSRWCILHILLLFHGAAIATSATHFCLYKFQLWYLDGL